MAEWRIEDYVFKLILIVLRNVICFIPFANFITIGFNKTTRRITMKHNYPLLILMVFKMLLLSNNLDGQTVVKGIILDERNNDPLIGANVVVKGTDDGATTDYEGEFIVKTEQDFPMVLVVTYLGYTEKEVEIKDVSDKLTIKLAESSIVTEVIEVRGQRISDKQKAAPLTVESMDLLAIKETPSDNFYDGLGSLKGVDLTAASLGFKIINTRGFNSTSPVRSLQIIDGVDNQAPGLNFSLGNFLGSSELDVLKVDLIVGASSAFYGPNAFNGVISMETKNPFLQKGLSAIVKGGERNLFETAVRYANSIQNGESQDVFAYKFNLSYMRADDWVADNYDPVDDSRVPADNPGRYDAVNIYGDEFYPLNDASGTALWNDQGLGIYYRTGYKEKDLVDYGTKNYKANAAFHFRTNPKLDLESPELILSSSFGSGTTVYQGDNRFSLRNILFFQNRLEFRKKDKWFIRAYATHEDAGDSYDPYFTALILQQAAKSNEIWGTNYRGYWKTNIVPKILENGYPQLVWDEELMRNTFDTDAALAWLVAYNDSLTYWHTLTEHAANMMSNNTTQDFLLPGTEGFNDEFKKITSAKSNDEEGGTKFYDKSALYHLQGEYIIETEVIDHITIGGNGRLYKPDSDGTIFYDTTETKISNWELGAYVGIDKEFFDKKLRGSFTIRIDKNQNFNLVSTPAASLVFKPRPNNFLRVSFSSAIRNPTLSDQYLYLNVGPAILAGNLEGVDSLITIDSYNIYRGIAGSLSDLEYFSIAPIQPEKVKTFEIGYRTTLYNRLYIDAGYYYSLYDDFLGYQIGIDAEFDQATGLPDFKNLRVYRYAANSINQVTTQGFSIGLNYYFWKFYQLSGNYSWNKLNTILDDPIVPAFNTPEHKFNIGISGRCIIIALGNKLVKGFGFNINYKWIEGFLFEGSPQFTGFIPTYDLLDAQINIRVSKIHSTFKLGASNLLNNMQFQTYGGPRIGRLAYFSILYEFNKQ